MAILNYPQEIVPKEISFTARTQATTFTSPFTGQSQTVKYTGEWWEATLSYPPLFRENADTLIGFLTGLRGMTNTFYWLPPTTLLMDSGSMTITVTGDGSTFTGHSGQVGRFAVDSVTYRLVQFTSTGSLFPALPTGSRSLVKNHGAHFRLMTNETTYNVNELKTYGTSIAVSEVVPL